MIGTVDGFNRAIVEDGVTGQADLRARKMFNFQEVSSDIYGPDFKIWKRFSLCCRAFQKIHVVPSCFLKNYLLSAHQCNSSKRAYAFLCLLYNRRTCGTFWGASADEPSGWSHATFSDNEPCNTIWEEIEETATDGFLIYIYIYVPIDLHNWCSYRERGGIILSNVKSN